MISHFELCSSFQLSFVTFRSKASSCVLFTFGSTEQFLKFYFSLFPDTTSRIHPGYLSPVVARDEVYRCSLTQILAANYLWFLYIATG